MTESPTKWTCDAKTYAVVAANAELLLLYWHIGREILERHGKQRWGVHVVDRLAEDLRREYPSITCWSRSNLLRMRAFAEAWVDERFVEKVLGQLTWSHQLVLLDELDDETEREWYVQAAIAHGWGRDMLVHQIEAKAHEWPSAGVASANNAQADSQSELVQQLFKDPHVFDFLTRTSDARAHDADISLVGRLQAFLMGPGKGFAFIGRRHALSAGGQDYFLDLLFYNTKLHCYVVVELTTDNIRREAASNMGRYLDAVDDQLKSGRDEPSVGMILCKTNTGVNVTYAMRDSTQPTSVAEFTVLPAELAGVMPAVEQIEAAFANDLNAAAHHSPRIGDSWTQNGDTE